MNGPAGPIVVVKLGGSLLDWPGWPTRLVAFLANLPDDPRVVLVVGGGRFADILRDLDETHGLGEATAHALALRVLDTTAYLAAALLPDSRVVADLADLAAAWTLGLLPILAPRRFLDRDDQSPDPLPHRWTTTTDSIAARVATHLGAAHLVLLKSRPLPPEATDWTTAATLGLVDPEFARRIGGDFQVKFFNLRRGDFQEDASSSSSD